MTQPTPSLPRTASSPEALLAGLSRLDRLLTLYAAEDDAIWKEVQSFLGNVPCALFLETHVGIVQLCASSPNYSSAIPHAITLAARSRAHLMNLPEQQAISEAQTLFWQQLFPQQESHEQILLTAFLLRHRKLGFCLCMPEQPATPTFPLGLLWQVITDRLIARLSLQALEYNQDYAIQQWLSQLLLHHIASNYQEQERYHQGLALGVDVQQPHIVALLSIRQTEQEPAGLLLTAFPRLRQRIRHVFPLAEMALLDQEGAIAILLPTSPQSPHMLASLRQMVRESTAIPLVAGISNPRQTVKDYREAFHEAYSALIAGQRQICHGEVAVFHIHDFGIARFLNPYAPLLHPTDQYVQAIQTLATYDRDHNTMLLFTLEKYLAAGGKVTLTAEWISQAQGTPLHENTVRQRIARASEISGLDLTESTQWMPLVLALTRYHMQ